MAFRKLLSFGVYASFPFGFEGGKWDLIVFVPEHCLSFYIAFATSTPEHLTVQRQAERRIYNATHLRCS